MSKRLSKLNRLRLQGKPRTRLSFTRIERYEVADGRRVWLTPPDLPGPSGGPSQLQAGDLIADHALVRTTDHANGEPLSRRAALRRCTVAAAGLLATTNFNLGCTGSKPGLLRTPELIWGRKGLSDGRLMKPRAMAIDASDRVYVVDMTGRIQVFNRDGKYLRGWRTPEIVSGRPTGLGVAQDGSLLVADTHYHRILKYSPAGELITECTIGGEFGNEPSQFHFVTDVVQDQRGHILAGQYGELDQIQEFAPDGTFIRRWGKHGNELDAFDRPQALLTDHQNRLWVADSCNHRILIFDLVPDSPKLTGAFGSSGRLPGQLQYPYGIAMDRDGTLLVAEYGNHRVQRFSQAGKSLDVWGEPGSGPGQFSSPWSLAIDSLGATHVLDTLNHRVQRFPAQST